MVDAAKHTLETVLADIRSDADAADRLAQPALAKVLLKIAQRVEDATEDYRTWLDEPDAMLQSGESKAALHRKFNDWLRAGHARWNPRHKGQRQYRSFIVPRRRSLAEVRADASRAARGTDVDERISA